MFVQLNMGQFGTVRSGIIDLLCIRAGREICSHRDLPKMCRLSSKLVNKFITAVVAVPQRIPEIVMIVHIQSISVRSVRFQWKTARLHRRLQNQRIDGRDGVIALIRAMADVGGPEG